MLNSMSQWTVQYLLPIDQSFESGTQQYRKHYSRSYTLGWRVRFYGPILLSRAILHLLHLI